MIKVVRGNPTPEELAAALAVVRARAAATASSYASSVPKTCDVWAASAHAVPRRTLPQPSSTAWRSTYWPR